MVVFDKSEYISRDMSTNADDFTSYGLSGKSISGVSSRVLHSGADYYTLWTLRHWKDTDKKHEAFCFEVVLSVCTIAEF